MQAQSEEFLNTVRGKALVGNASKEEILAVFGHLDELESLLDEADENDTFGPEGWRHRLGIAD